MKKNTKAILEALEREYGTEHVCYLNHENALQLLIATMLSAQCTDARVNIVTESLFQKYITAEDFANADLRELEQEIHSTGFYHNKAKNIIACCKQLVEKYGGEVPNDLDALTSLAGVGRKTANVVRGNIFHGTKVGALCGEAVVFTKNNKPAHFMTSVKKRGALLAKGRLLGIQFDTLFTDDLYFRISRHAIDMAERVKEIIREKGWKVYMDSPTNQQLILMTEEEMAELGKTVIFDRWGIYDDTHTIVRLATSWSTTEEDIAVLAEA